MEKQLKQNLIFIAVSAAVLLGLAASLPGQTKGTPGQINGTGAPGAGLCVANSVGQHYFQTDATAGQNDWFCTSTGWVLSVQTAVQSGTISVCSSVVGTDAYACNYAPAFTAYDADGTCVNGEICTGTIVQFYADVQNTGSGSFAPNGLAAKTIKKGGKNQNLQTGDIEAGQVVTIAYNRVSDVWQYQSQLSTVVTGTSSGLVLRETQVASASAALNFTNCFSADYDDYLIILSGFYSTAGSPGIVFQVSTDGGSSYITTGSYTYVLRFTNSGGSGQSGSTTQTSIPTGGTTNTNTATFGLSARVTVHRPLDSTGSKWWNAETASYDGSFYQTFNSVGGYNSGTAINAFRIIPESSTIAAGTARCYGYAK